MEAVWAEEGKPSERLAKSKRSRATASGRPELGPRAHGWISVDPWELYTVVISGGPTKDLLALNALHADRIDTWTRDCSPGGEWAGRRR